MEPKHYAIIGAMLIAIGTQLSGMVHGWHDAMTPTFVGGLIIQVGTTLTAMLLKEPTATVKVKE